MISLRIMSQTGEDKFREYIKSLRNNSLAPCPDDLNNHPYSEEFYPKIQVDESKVFATKMDLAQYLDGIFSKAGVRREEVLGKNGLWTWLAYLWFNQLTHVDDSAGMRKIDEPAKYICSSDYRDYYRHFVAGPYNIYSLHRNNAGIFLYSPVYEHNDFIEQIASRQFIISHQNLIEAFSILYFDGTSKRPKKGAQSRKRPGNIRRFVKIIQQLELTYDIYSMSAQQIIDRLPHEFKEWKR